MGSHTQGLLPSTWTTPNALVPPPPRRQAPPRPRPPPPARLLVRAREHKRPGRALRRSPRRLPPLQRLPHPRSKTQPPYSPPSFLLLCCASSLHHPALPFLIHKSTELLIRKCSLPPSLPLWFPGQGRSWPTGPSPGQLTRVSPPTILLVCSGPGEVLFPGLEMPDHVTGACWRLQRRASGKL